MLAKFNFSKIEDIKRFDKLPKAEQNKISDEAQEEASLINEIVGEKGSKEDYEIVAKLAEEEIAAKKEIEILKEMYKQRLDEILNSQLTIENIETFADNALAQATNFIGDIKTQFQKYGSKYNLSISDDAEQEDEALKFFNLPDVPDILQSIIKVKEKIDNLKMYVRTNVAGTNEVITPPDNRKINPGNGQGMEQKRMLPRVLTLLYILEHDFDIPPDDAPITRGMVESDMVRQTPYMRVEVPRLERVVYLCDEEGNASYVFDAAKIYGQNITLNELDLYTKDDKNYLISECPGIGIRIIQTNKWRNNIAAALKEPISERNVLEDADQTSEFRREKKNWLSFEDFQKEVKDLYSGKGYVAKWYRQEYKNHSDWPSNPDKLYKNKGWEGWSELVGKDNHLKKERLSFENFQQEVKDLYPGGDVITWYRQKYKKHSCWPSNPDRLYKNKGWEGWPELVGRENKLKKEWLSFEDFQQEIKKLYPGRGDVYKWYKQERKNHSNWPGHPGQIYKGKWKGFPELIGKENFLKKEWLSFEDFQKEAKNLYPGKGSVLRWYKREHKNHDNWPSHPDLLYQDNGWGGWSELIGKKSFK